MGAYPEFTSVSSSNIFGVSYDASDNSMYVEFVGGSTYRYIGVPEDVYEGLVSSGSPGSYLHNNVKGVYPAQRV